MDVYETGNCLFTNFLQNMITNPLLRVPKNPIKHFTESKMTLLNYINLLNKGFTIPEKGFTTIEERDTYYRWWCEVLIVPKKYRPIKKQYLFIESQPQYEQKSQEWLDQRKNFITASSGAEAIGESKYTSARKMMIDKVGLGKPFKENKNVWHGKKSETIATLIYEYIYNVKVGEFGLIPHLGKGQNKVPFLGASPDGICTWSTLDGQFTDFLGIMLEIKCVTSRVINDTGPEHILHYTEKKDPGIVPHYYWVQIQLQLECCNLELCHFWQCKLIDYWSLQLLEKGIRENPVTKHVREQGIEYNIDPRLEVGTFIELLPKDTSNIPSDEKVMWYGKYIYPPNMLTSLEKKIEWAQMMKIRWKEFYPQYVQDYNFGKIIYYRLEKSHCYLVKRDKTWFNEALPRFRTFWDQVLLYRDNPEKKKELINELALEEAKKMETKRKSRMEVKFEED